MADERMDEARRFALAALAGTIGFFPAAAKAGEALGFDREGKPKTVPGPDAAGSPRTEAGAQTIPANAKSLIEPVSPEEFGARGDGTPGDGPALQKALDTARPIILKQRGNYNIGTTGLKLRFTGQIIAGNNAELHYYGNATALDFELDGSGIYRTNTVIHDLTIYLYTDSATGFRWRSSYANLSNVSVALYASNQIGFLIDVDFKNGTGPYYNNFSSCHVQGHAFQKGISNQIGWKYTSYLAQPARGPNANLSIAGRSSGCSTNFQICGVGNTLIAPVSETVPPGGWHFRFENAHDTKGQGCTGNAVTHAYLEGLSGANGFYVSRYASGTAILYPNITSIEAGVVLEDHGVGTTWQSSDGIRMPNVASSDARTLDWYEEGVFTPTIAGRTAAGRNSYSKQHGSYTRIGNRVHCDIAITMTAKDPAMSGYVVVNGLPFPAAPTGTSAVAIGSAKLDLASGYQVGGTIGPSSSSIVLMQIGDKSDAVVAGAAILDDTYIVLSFTYQA